MLKSDKQRFKKGRHPLTIAEVQETQAKRTPRRFARIPVKLAGNTEELLAARYTVTDKVVSQKQIDIATEDGYSIKVGKQVLQWTSDSWHHLIGDLNLQERDPEDQILLRSVGNVLIGGLTDQYVPVANSSIIDSLVKAELQVVKARVSPTRSQFFATYPEIVDVDGEEWKLGVYVVNSETGWARLQVHAGLYKLICANGAVAWGSGMQIDSKHDLRSLSKDFSIEEYLPAALEFGRAQVEVLPALKGIELTMDVVEDFIDENNLGPRHVMHLFNFLGDISSGKTSQYNLMNAVTQLHQAFPKTATRWMEIGGRLLDASYFTEQVEVDQQVPTSEQN